MVSQQRFAEVKMLVCCVDGVLTNGAIIYGSGNVESRAFHSKDGVAIRVAARSGLPVVWLAGRVPDPVSRRAAELNVQVYAGHADTEAGLRAAVQDHGFIPEEVAYIGADLGDLPGMRLVGFPIAVADAAPEVQELAAHVTQAAGGEGAVREIIEQILRAQNRWEEGIEKYLAFVRGAGPTPRLPRSVE